MRKVCLLFIIWMKIAVVLHAQDFEHVKGVCKNPNTYYINFKETKHLLITKNNIIITENQRKQPLFLNSGNVSYFFNYRSFLDTPFQQQDLMQHVVQARVDMQIAKHIPVSMFINHRNSNSPFFSNLTDVTFSFCQAQLIEKEKQQLRLKIEQKVNHPFLTMPSEQAIELMGKELLNGNINELQKNLNIDEILTNELNVLAQKYNALKNKLNGLKESVQGINLIQLQIEAKEKITRERLEKEQRLKDTLLNKNQYKSDSTWEFKNDKFVKIKQPKINLDSTSKNVEDKLSEIEGKKAKIDSIQKQLNQFHQKIAAIQKNIKDTLEQKKQEINKITSGEKLKQFIQNNKQKNALDSLTRFQKILYSINKVGLGRTWIDYSDLTVKNLSLNGINIEATHNKLYAATAIGTLNYRFRDFVLRDDFFRNSQSLMLFRFGYKYNESTSLIATFYSGTKALLNTVGVTSQQAVRPIKGFALEYSFKLDQHNAISAEYARSETLPFINSKLFDFSNRTSEAWMVKWKSSIAITSTKIDAFYRKIGQDFQSFTLLPSLTTNDAWMFKVRQPFIKNKLNVEASVRKNDFTNQFSLIPTASSTIFKTLQITFKAKKLPFVSVGYFPSSQLSIIGQNTIIENQFNTLNAIVNHYYNFGNKQFSTSLLYNKFYNSGNDTGFIYHNATTLSFTQNVFVNRFNFSAVATKMVQTILSQTSIEFGTTYNAKSKFSITTNAKYTNVPNAGTYWGYLIGCMYNITKHWQIQLNYNKSYLPNFQRQLVPLDIGRLVLSKDF